MENMSPSGKRRVTFRCSTPLHLLVDIRISICVRLLRHCYTLQRFWWRHDPEKMRILAEKQYWWDTMLYLFQDGMPCSVQRMVWTLYCVIKHSLTTFLYCQCATTRTSANMSNGPSTKTISPTRSGMAPDTWRYVEHGPYRSGSR